MISSVTIYYPQMRRETGQPIKIQARSSQISRTKVIGHSKIGRNAYHVEIHRTTGQHTEAIIPVSITSTLLIITIEMKLAWTTHVTRKIGTQFSDIWLSHLTIITIGMTGVSNTLWTLLTESSVIVTT